MRQVLRRRVNCGAMGAEDNTNRLFPDKLFTKNAGGEIFEVSC